MQNVAVAMIASGVSAHPTNANVVKTKVTSGVGLIVIARATVVSIYPSPKRGTGLTVLSILPTSPFLAIGNDEVCGVYVV